MLRKHWRHQIKTILLIYSLKLKEQANTTIASLTAEIKHLNETFQKLESDVSIVKNVNNILSKQNLINWEAVLEKRPVFAAWMCWDGGDKDLEPTVCRVLQHIGVVITIGKYWGMSSSKQTEWHNHPLFFKEEGLWACHAKKSELRKVKPSELIYLTGQSSA